MWPHRLREREFPPGPVRAPERACATRGPPNEKGRVLDDPAVLDTTELAAAGRG
ncbi:hypothetical protein [Frankia sp. EAN1pec]|uniref:hypothetical protein n=1 Tax=Parafrankia sp. (strain EAN1pec) TaxID=298653 RepID=UPI0012F9BDFD